MQFLFFVFSLHVTWIEFGWVTFEFVSFKWLGDCSYVLTSDWFKSYFQRFIDLCVSTSQQYLSSNICLDLLLRTRVYQISQKKYHIINLHRIFRVWTVDEPLLFVWRDISYYIESEKMTIFDLNNFGRTFSYSKKE